MLDNVERMEWEGKISSQSSGKLQRMMIDPFAKKKTLKVEMWKERSLKSLLATSMRKKIIHLYT